MIHLVKHHLNIKNIVLLLILSCIIRLYVTFYGVKSDMEVMTMFMTNDVEQLSRLTNMQLAFNSIEALSFGLFFSGLLGLLIKRSNVTNNYNYLFMLIPLAGGASDIAGNTITLIATYSYLDHWVIIELVNMLFILKLSSIYFTVLLVILFLVPAIVV